MLRAMGDIGLSKAQLTGMLSMLDNPLASGLLNKISPGLTGQLKNLGQSIAGEKQGEPSANGTPTNSWRDKYPPIK